MSHPHLVKNRVKSSVEISLRHSKTLNHRKTKLKLSYSYSSRALLQKQNPQNPIPPKAPSLTMIASTTSTLPRPSSNSTAPTITSHIPTPCQTPLRPSERAPHKHQTLGTPQGGSVLSATRKFRCVFFGHLRWRHRPILAANCRAQPRWPRLGRLE